MGVQMKFIQNLFTKKKQPPVDDMAVDVLARTIWGESRGQPIKGMEAVANVVMNRVAIAKKNGGKYWWGNDVISVCKRPFQFSCWNPNDPNLPKMKAVTEEDKNFRISLDIARRAVSGKLPDHTFGATHYFASYVLPDWAKGRKPTITIGDHIFFDLKGA